MAVDQQRIPPNQSIYIQNLPEKIQKDDLRRELYMLFSTYGPVIDVTALKNQKMRGQAHVLFKDVSCATQAIRGCQGFGFYGREMKLSYSKNRSNTIAKLTGNFNQPAPGEQQKQIAQPPSSFPAPPGSAPTNAAPPSTLPPPPSGLPPPPGLPAKPTAGNAIPPQVAQAAAQGAPSPQGVKRDREESDEEGSDDDEGAMEMSESDSE
ncbi:uncharacterized protein LTR77_002075 [Saxophila tyrrhenica]|uniref:RRM domain-containing protein n=1 Tax=Saxophila tyrrhenica TaxID=1690608 RepID=A0AAV9PIG9_9PEZI|nr:hypothetical protein LTR77_002075 [Saxophila tyrrhenica]